MSQYRWPHEWKQGLHWASVKQVLHWPDDIVPQQPADSVHKSKTRLLGKPIRQTPCGWCHLAEEEVLTGIAALVREVKID